MASSKRSECTARKAEVVKLREQGLSDEEISEALGVDVRIVGAIGSPRRGRAIDVSDDEKVALFAVMKTLANTAESEFCRLSAAKFLINEHFGRNDKTEVTVNNHNVQIVSASITAANARLFEKLGINRKEIDSITSLPTPPPEPAPRKSASAVEQDVTEAFAGI